MRLTSRKHVHVMYTHVKLELAQSSIKELTNTHEPIQEIMMVFLFSERRTTTPVNPTFIQ